MQVFNLIILFTLFQSLLASTCSPRIQRVRFRAIIFKEKKYPRIVEYVKNKYQIYFEKALVYIGEAATEYENLSYEEKEIIDLMISTIAVP